MRLHYESQAQEEPSRLKDLPLYISLHSSRAPGYLSRLQSTVNPSCLQEGVNLYYSTPWVKYGLYLQSLFGLHVHSCTNVGWDPATPPPAHLGSYTRALLVSQYRRRLFVTPCSSVFRIAAKNPVSFQAKINFFPFCLYFLPSNWNDSLFFDNDLFYIYVLHSTVHHRKRSQNLPRKWGQSKF